MTVHPDATYEVLKISALSVNQAWQGRRFKTKKYKDYEEHLLLILPNLFLTF
jgi:hypothetical protein